MAAISPVCHPRKPIDSPLWKILHNHYPDFKSGYDEHCEKQYGFFRPVVEKVVRDGCLRSECGCRTLYAPLCSFRFPISDFRPLFMTHSSNKRNFEIFSPEEFIAAITQHIPDKHFQMVKYYGWYSSRSRGERIKACLFRPGDETMSSTVSPEVTVLDVSDHRLRRVPSKTWRELINKACAREDGYLGVDSLCCPRCTHEWWFLSSHTKKSTQIGP